VKDLPASSVQATTSAGGPGGKGSQMSSDSYAPPTVRRVGGPCDACGLEAKEICVDCYMDTDGERRFVCATTACRDAHEAKHPAEHPTIRDLK
jgi:alpha-D-ribose 1-methylphosphonate 5-phosphate C-P lyase